MAQGPVNINTATLAELEVLPGIGPVSAQRIIDFRNERGPFSTVEQLVEVKGIGEKSLDKLRPLVSAN
jgi:competence protein ComEA